MKEEKLIILLGVAAGILRLIFPPKVAFGGEGRIAVFGEQLAQVAVVDTPLLALELAAIALITFALWFIFK